MRSEPPKWSEKDLARESDEAVRRFRDMRINEPLEDYLSHFETYRQQVETLIEGTVDLTRLSSQAVELLTSPEQLTAVRYLASPAISEDDLKVLADAALTPKRLRADPEMARRVIDTVLLGLDRERFPWVAEDREPSEAERATAVVSTAALIATQKVQTGRRTRAKKDQEGAVADALRSAGFVEAPTRRIESFSDFPGCGEFCAEAHLGEQGADRLCFFFRRGWADVEVARARPGRRDAGPAAGGAAGECSQGVQGAGDVEGHGLSPCLGRGGPSVVASSGPGGSSSRSRGPAGAPTPMGPGGKAPDASSHPPSWGVRAPAPDDGGAGAPPDPSRGGGR